MFLANHNLGLASIFLWSSAVRAIRCKSGTKPRLPFTQGFSKCLTGLSTTIPQPVNNRSLFSIAKPVFNFFHEYLFPSILKIRPLYQKARLLFPPIMIRLFLPASTLQGQGRQAHKFFSYPPR